MGRRSPLLVLLLLTTCVAGCSASADRPIGDGAATEAASYDGPASLDHPLGTGVLGVDQRTLRTALLETLRSAGGVRAAVSGGPYDVVVEVDPTPDPEMPDGRRFRWRQDGVEREQLHLAEDRVCVNRASAEPIRRTMSAATHAGILFSDRAYSCTTPSQVTAFLTQGLVPFDPVRRLETIDEWSGIEDRGTETGADGTVTRHLRLDGAHGSTTEPPVPWDLWLDEDLHVTRMQYDEFVATLDYGPVPAVALPPAGDRGPIRLVFLPVGSGRLPVTPP